VPIICLSLYASPLFDALAIEWVEPIGQKSLQWVEVLLLRHPGLWAETARIFKKLGTIN
jgi:hypothetical protein